MQAHGGDYIKGTPYPVSMESLSDLLLLARLSLGFGRVHRATYHPHPDPRHESDTDHTYMLGLVAVSLAHNHPEWGLWTGRLLEFVVVHDLPEVYANDTNTFGITAEQSAAKKEREIIATERLLAETMVFPWIRARLTEYEAQMCPESRFVRYLDKILPKLTHILNNGLAFSLGGVPPERVTATHDAQIQQLRVEYPDIAAFLEPLLLESCTAAVQAYEVRSRPGFVDVDGTPNLNGDPSEGGTREPLPTGETG